MLGTILLVFAFVFFIVRSFQSGGPLPGQSWPFPHLGWMGLAFWVASILFGSGGVLGLR